DWSSDVCSSDLTDPPIAPLVARGQRRMMFVGPPHQSILDAGFAQPRMPGVGVIGLIAIDRGLVAADQGIAELRIRDRGIGRDDAADEGVLGIDADVDLVTECALLALAAPARVGIGRSLAGLPVPDPGLAR